MWNCQLRMTHLIDNFFSSAMIVTQLNVDVLHIHKSPQRIHTCKYVKKAHTALH